MIETKHRIMSEQATIDFENLHEAGQADANNLLEVEIEDAGVSDRTFEGDIFYSENNQVVITIGASKIDDEGSLITVNVDSKREDGNTTQEQLQMTEQQAKEYIVEMEASLIEPGYDRKIEIPITNEDDPLKKVRIAAQKSADIERQKVGNLVFDSSLKQINSSLHDSDFNVREKFESLKRRTRSDRDIKMPIMLAYQKLAKQQTKDSENTFNNPEHESLWQRIKDKPIDLMARWQTYRAERIANKKLDSNPRNKYVKAAIGAVAVIGVIGFAYWKAKNGMSTNVSPVETPLPNVAGGSGKNVAIFDFFNDVSPAAKHANKLSSVQQQLLDAGGQYPIDSYQSVYGSHATEEIFKAVDKLGSKVVEHGSRNSSEWWIEVPNHKGTGMTSNTKRVVEVLSTGRV